MHSMSRFSSGRLISYIRPEVGQQILFVEQDFLCTFVVHKRSFFVCKGEII